MEVFPARRHGLAPERPCRADACPFRVPGGVPAVFRQMDARACRGKKTPPGDTRKSEGPAEREFLCRRLGRPVLGVRPRAEAKQRTFPKREMPPPVRGRSLRVFYTEAGVRAPACCKAPRTFVRGGGVLKVFGQAAVLQQIKFGRLHGAEIQRDAENVR